MKAHYWETRLSMTSQKALQFLKEGNERFLNNLRVNRNMLQLINETAEQQFPFTAILSCSDSRAPVELVFDQGLGDIFSIRLAGNIASDNAVGSMEYACKVLGSKLLLVMGHTNCGAVKGAADGFQMENLNGLLAHIRPAVDSEQEIKTDRNSNNKLFIENVSRLNVRYQMDTILRKSGLLREMVDSGEVGLAGAIYNIETGKVHFMDDGTSPKTVDHDKMEIYQG